MKLMTLPCRGLILACAGVLILCGSAIGQTAGPNNAGTGTSIPLYSGTFPWNNPGNIAFDDNVYAYVNMNVGSSDYLMATNYGFSIPAEATILGIRVTVGRYQFVPPNCSVKKISDRYVYIVKNGSVTGNNYGAIGLVWPTTETPITYGSMYDLWGTTWTPADINNPGFGVAVAVWDYCIYTGYVDYMQITVTYLLSGAVYRTSGTGSFTVPEGVNCIKVETWGGGGRGGSRVNTSGNGGGGGGGAYSRSVLPVIPGTIHDVVVGSGSNNDAQPGGSSWFDAGQIVLAVGGSSAGENVEGAPGGPASSCTGETRYSGGNGGNGTTIGDNYGGGGGAGAGRANNGANGSTLMGGPGSNGGGSGGNGVCGAVASTNYGYPGLTAGGGGGGCYRPSFTGGYTGGPGATGMVLITWEGLTATAAPVITAPVYEEATSVSGTAANNAAVSLYSGTTPIGTGTATGTGAWTITTTALTAGEVLTATAKAVDLCVSTASATVTVLSNAPTITLGANPAICRGILTAALPYTATTGSPDQYSIDYDAVAQGQGFSDVTNASLPSPGPILLAVPSTAATGTYNGSLTVRNSSNGLSGISYPISVTVRELPAASATGTDITCFGAGDGEITITVTAGLSPYYFSIDNGGTYTSLSYPSPYTITGLGPGTYNVRVKDSNNCVSGE